MWTSEFYLTRLYPVQNQALRLITDLGAEFYLTDETALSRGYLNHRFSDDLDFFVNRTNTLPISSDWARR
ncbi:MAG: hypothetical protein ACUVRU_05165 [Anaerolineae bacterium]